MDDGRPVPVASGGGLAGSLHPLVEGTGATWVASSLSEADREASAAGLMTAPGLRVELVEPDRHIYSLAYDVVSNATLWFCHHHLFDRRAGRVPTDGGWRRGTPTAPSTSSWPNGWPRSPPTAGGCWCRTTTWP